MRTHCVCLVCSTLPSRLRQRLCSRASRDVLEAAKAKLEALAQLVAWLQKPAQWLPGQVTSMTARPTDPRKEKAKATLWGGSASTLAKGMAYAKKENKMLAALDEADEQTTYRVQLATSEAAGAGTDATVRIELIGAKRSSGVIMLNSGQEGRFVTGAPAIADALRTICVLRPPPRRSYRDACRSEWCGRPSADSCARFLTSVGVTDQARRSSSRSARWSASAA